MNKIECSNAGFTLIELILVIVILGIVSVTASSRFINLGTDAQIAALNGMVGAISSASNIVAARARVEGQTGENGSLVIDGGNAITLHFGYARASWNLSMRYMINLDDINFSDVGVECQNEWCGRGTSGGQPFTIDGDISLVNSQTGRIVKVWPRGYAWEDRCSAHYINNQDGTPPIIGISTSDC